jgi:hypothetical protein
MTYAEEIPGFNLVAHKEVAVPWFHYKCEFLFSIKRPLPILQEYILELLNLEVPLMIQQQLLGLDYDVVRDAYYRLIQNGFVEPDGKGITLRGEEYLSIHSVDKLEKGEYEIFVNSFTKDVDTSTNSGMTGKAAQHYCCYKAYVKSIEIEDLNKRQMLKVLREYCEHNELGSDARLVDITKLIKRATIYRKIDLLLYENHQGDNRIIVIENGKKRKGYEDILYALDSSGIDILQMPMVSIRKFFASDEVQRIYAFCTSKKLQVDKDMIEMMIELSNPTIILPLTETSYFVDYTLRIIRDKLANEESVKVLICGDRYLKNFQEDFISDLLKLRKQYKRFLCSHLSSFLPPMVITSETGCIHMLTLSELGLESTKIGLVDSFYLMPQECINFVNSVLTLHRESISISNFPDMKKIERLWSDFDVRFMSKYDFSIFPDSGMRNRASFIGLSPATNKAEFDEFLNIVNMAIFESLKRNAKHAKSDGKFFWTKFKLQYPKLFKVLDKLRVYRNKADHITLDDNNKELYYEYLNEDTNGVFIELLPDGYEYLQTKLLNQMHVALTEYIFDE